jgi:hypothetical protein
MKRLVGWLAVAAALAAAPMVYAGVAPNGMMPNGMMPNGMMPNGMMPNGMMPNGMMPNGMMPNGMMPNGMMPNGMMPNGMMPNGMMPNGMTGYSIVGDIWADVNGVPVTFDQWFAVDPAARSNFMTYFVRCAYGPDVQISYPSKVPVPAGVVDAASCTGAPGEICDRALDLSTGSQTPTYRWDGFIGLAQTTLDAGQKMTVDEAKWISSCLLAFVNTKGTHQYLSLRLLEGNELKSGVAPSVAPSAAAAAALSASDGEKRTMRWRFGVFMADLDAPSPTKYACAGNPQAFEYFPHVEQLLGRTCDTSDCTYVDPVGQTQHILTAHVGGCPGLPGAEPQLPVTWNPENHDADIGGTTYHPIVVYGPDLGEYESVRPAAHVEILGFGTEIRMVDVAWCGKPYQQKGFPEYTIPCLPDDLHFTREIDPAAQKVACPNDVCLGTVIGTTDPIYGPPSGKLVGLVDGQAIDAVKRAATNDADPNQPFTAIIRYRKARTASADIWTSAQGGGWWKRTTYNASLHGEGPDVWVGTGASEDAFEWLQVYPVYPAQGLHYADHLNLRVAGAAYSESCTGTVLYQGPNERGSCLDPSLPKTTPPKKETVCPKQYEASPGCRGSLVWTKRNNVEGWYCRGGGEALYACTADDAPELDAIGFVPGKPWCAPDGVLSFIGVCR